MGPAAPYAWGGGGGGEVPGDPGPVVEGMWGVVVVMGGPSSCQPGAGGDGEVPAHPNPVVVVVVMMRRSQLIPTQW